MAVISPVGGALKELVLNGQPIVSDKNLKSKDSMFFGSVLAPWPNRLANAEYEYLGQKFQTPNVDLDRNSNHGLVFNRTFQVLAQSESSVTVGYLFGRDPSYPFEVKLEVTYELGDSELAVRAKAKCLAGSAPFGLGFHPYLLAEEPFSFSAEFTRQITTNEKMIPIGEKQIPGFSYEGGPLDDCFSGSRIAKFKTGSFEVDVLLQENLHYFMLYRPDLSCGESLLAIEPMSCLANAFNSAIHETVLREEEEKNFSFLIRMR